MSIIDINKYKQKLTTKRKICIVIVILIILMILGLIISYIKIENFREWADNYVFKKNIENKDIASINIDLSNNQSIYAFDKYITILEKNMLTLYNSNAMKVCELDVNINSPIYAKNGKYLCIAENGGKNIYLISGGNIVWQGNVDGTIQKINVNKNGYVSVIEKGTSYKNIIITYNNEGREQFKTYLSSNSAIATDISDDNLYLAIAEIDTSGAIIKSSIKIISIDKAKKDPTNSIEKNISAQQGDLITNIKYQEKNKLLCIYDNSIHIIENGEDKQLITIDNKTNIADVSAKNSIVYSKEKSSGFLSTSTEIIIKNISNENEINYEVDSTIKFLRVYENNIAINLGTEADFINRFGWVQKKYKSSQEITQIVLGSSLAGVIYRDRIEIINL